MAAGVTALVAAEAATVAPVPAVAQGAARVPGTAEEVVMEAVATQQDV